MTTHDDTDLLAGLGVATQELTTTLDRSFDDVLGLIVAHAIEVVGPAVGAGISTSRGRLAALHHVGDENTRALDRLQIILNEGPVVAAAELPAPGGYVHASDLAGPDRDRWPSFSPRAVTHGYRSLLSLRVPGSPGHCSVLSLYARAPQAFDDGAILAARLFGLLTATLLHGLRDAEGLRVALATRDVIGQAKGVLAERCRLSDDEAFRLLVETSQQRSSKLVDVARGLVDEARRAVEALPPVSTTVPEGRLLAPGVRVPPPGPRRPRGGACAG